MYDGPLKAQIPVAIYSIIKKIIVKYFYFNFYSTVNAGELGPRGKLGPYGLQHLAQ